MVPRKRVRADERRAAILRAALPVFAEKGYAAATTRELAAAADVSEALLFRHFPSKEALYAATGEAFRASREAHPALGRILALPAGTAKLVRTVSYLVTFMAEAEPSVFPRLMVRSLLENGTFAREFLSRFSRDWLPGFAESIRAAADAGDLAVDAETARLGVWFSHHLGLALKLAALPGESAADYGRPRDEVIREATRFALRGLGVRPAAVERELGRD